MRDSLAGKIGREYLRVSARGERSIPEQHDDNGRAAEREGVTLGQPYQDQGSASRYAVRARDDFARLMSDLENDTFGADLLWLWESSRGSRRVGEWVLLIELCEERGVCVYVTTHGRVYDPADPRDRRTLLEDAVDSEYESAKISKRTKRGIDANARKGQPHGICPFGYAREYAIRRGERVFVRQHADPVEGPLIVELFKSVRARVSFRSIAADWERRGIVGRRGKPLSGQTLRDLVTHVCYIGLRETKGTTVKAAWPRLVSDELFYDVQRIVSDPSRIKGNPGAALYALTGAVTCAGCGSAITVRHRSKEDQYECRGGCWRVSKADVDAYFIGDGEHPGVIVAYLARPDIYEGLDAAGSGGEADEIRGELAKARADLQETEAAEPETLAEERRFARRAERLEERVGELEQRLKRLARPSSLNELFQPGPDVAARWEATPVSAQRAIAALLLSPEVIGRARIMPAAAPRSPGPVAERIEWVRAA
ncbi:recombinase family protein [Streptomyces sp. NPDC059037]|uniref:recombinase family protein n=1 Tax=Streptomyces sp. NPDC059037 TaxID=3346710 RepID=UPI0036AE983D